MLLTEYVGLKPMVRVTLVALAVVELGVIVRPPELPPIVTVPVSVWLPPPDRLAVMVYVFAVVGFISPQPDVMFRV